MANQRAKRPAAEEAREFLSEIVRGYYLTSEEERMERRNTGALKYLKYMYVNAIVLSPNPPKRMRKESFLNYFRNEVLPREYDALISYTDPEENLKAFLESPYFMPAEKAIIQTKDRIIGLFCNAEQKQADAAPLLPFLFLQYLQQIVEQNLDSYLHQKIRDPFDPQERTEQDDRNDIRKEEKYMYLVYSLQYYEIFLEEFRKRLISSGDSVQDQEALDRMQELNGKISACTDSDLKLQLSRELLEVTRECASALCRNYISVLYASLYVRHFINLMALLRVVAIIEYVNINHDFEKENPREIEVERRKKIELLVSEKLLEFDLYYFHFRNNPNLSKLFKELSATAEKRNLIPDPSNQEEMNAFHGDLAAYIKLIRKGKAGGRDAAEEAMLWKSQLNLAEPFLTKLAERNLE